MGSKKYIDIRDIENEKVIGDINKEIAEVILDVIRLQGFTPQSERFGNKCSMFLREPNSCVTFTVKELSKKWRFRIWVTSSPLLNLQSDVYENSGSENFPIAKIFCWHLNSDTYFIPQQSQNCVAVTVIDFKRFLASSASFWVGETFNMFTWIKYHPLLAFSGVFPKKYVDYDSANLRVIA